MQKQPWGQKNNSVCKEQEALGAGNMEGSCQCSAWGIFPPAGGAVQQNGGNWLPHVVKDAILFWGGNIETEIIIISY